MRTLLELYPGDQIALLAANVLVQVTVVLLLAWAVASWVARRSAAARHDVWLCALLGLLLSPAIAYTLDRAGVSIVSLPLLPAERVEPSPLAEEPAAERELPIGATWEPPLVDMELADTMAIFEAPEQAAAAPMASQPAAPIPLSRTDKLRVLLGAVAVIWGVGVLVLLARTVRGWQLLARLRREIRPPSTVKLDEIAEQVRRTLGIKRLPRIVVAPNVSSPITVGILRPLLILPKQLTRTLRRDQLRDVLLHECAHVARRDHLVGMLQLLAEMLFWPHPLVHVMNRQLARSREEVCDNYVLRHGDGPRYAQTLLELSRKLVPTRTRLAALGLCHPRWRLEDRIGGLLDQRRGTMTRMNACFRSLMVCVLLTAATVVAGTRIVAAQPKEPPAPNAEETQRDVELPPAADPWGPKGAGGLQIRLVIPKSPGQSVPALTDQRYFKAPRGRMMPQVGLEVKNAGEKTIKVAEYNWSSGRKIALDEWLLGLSLEMQDGDGFRRLTRTDDQDGYWSVIGHYGARSQEIKPGETVAFGLRVDKLADERGRPLASFHGARRLRPVLHVHENKSGRWHGTARGKFVPVVIGNKPHAASPNGRYLLFADSQVSIHGYGSTTWGDHLTLADSDGTVLWTKDIKHAGTCVVGIHGTVAIAEWVMVDGERPEREQPRQEDSINVQLFDVQGKRIASRSLGDGKTNRWYFSAPSIFAGAFGPEDKRFYYATAEPVLPAELCCLDRSGRLQWNAKCEGIRNVQSVHVAPDGEEVLVVGCQLADGGLRPFATFDRDGKPLKSGKIDPIKKSIWSQVGIGEEDLKTIWGEVRISKPVEGEQPTRDEIDSTEETERPTRRIPQVSPTGGLSDEDLSWIYGRHGPETPERRKSLDDLRKKLLASKKTGKTRWGSEKWMKTPEYYAKLDTATLAEECFARAIFYNEVSIYNDPRTGFVYLLVFHDGFAELYGRDDFWKGILHAYDSLSQKLVDPETSLREIGRVSGHLDEMRFFYGEPKFRRQLKGREKLFLEAHIRVLRRYARYMDHHDFKKRASFGFWREPWCVAKVALMLTKQVDPGRYARIAPEIEAVRFSEGQKPEELKRFVQLVLSSLTESTENESAARDKLSKPKPYPPIARAVDPDARERFLEIERIARLPAQEQAKQLPHVYRELAPRYMNPFVEGIVSSFRRNILDPKSIGGGGPRATGTWTEQLVDAAKTKSPEEIADAVGSGMWLNIAAKKRVLWILGRHAEPMDKLLEDDLDSGDKASVRRAACTIGALQRTTFSGKLLQMYLADDEMSEVVWAPLLFTVDKSDIFEPLLKKVEKDPRLLIRIAGLFQGPLYRQPAEPMLLKLVFSEDKQISYYAARALYECKDPKLAPLAAQFAKDPSARFRTTAAYWASNMDPGVFQSVRQELLPLLADKDEKVRFDALRCFAQQKDLAAGPIILELLKKDQLAEQFKTTVMQAMSKLAGSHFKYFMHEWGPARAGNRRAIQKFEAWLEQKKKSEVVI